MFDAVAVILSTEGCAMLLKQGAAVQFVMDAFGHLKAIGASDAAAPLLDKAGVVPDEGVVSGHSDLASLVRVDHNLNTANTRIFPAIRQPHARTRTTSC